MARVDCFEETIRPSDAFDCVLLLAADQLSGGTPISLPCAIDRIMQGGTHATNKAPDTDLRWGNLAARVAAIRVALDAAFATGWISKTERRVLMTGCRIHLRHQEYERRYYLALRTGRKARLPHLRETENRRILQAVEIARKLEIPFAQAGLIEA